MMQVNGDAYIPLLLQVGERELSVIKKQPKATSSQDVPASDDGPGGSPTALKPALQGS